MTLTSPCMPHEKPCYNASGSKQWCPISHWTSIYDGSLVRLLLAILSPAEALRHAGGDAFISICLWRLGFAHTDPGPWFNDPAMRLFDAAAWMGTRNLAARLFEAAEGLCTDAICQVEALLNAAVRNIYCLQMVKQQILLALGPT